MLDDAFNAATARDCTRLGEIVNAGIDARSPRLLYMAGLIYDEGLCVEPDAARSKRFYEAGAAAGDQSAAVELGLRYALGDGVPRSYGRASVWLEHASGLELRKLEESAAAGSALSEQQRSRLETLAARPRVRQAADNLPAMPAATDVDAEWSGYLYSTHYLAARLMQYRYPRAALVAGVQASFLVRACPVEEKTSIERLRLGSDRGPSTAQLSAEREMRAAIEDAYARAQAMLPRPMKSPPTNDCIRTTVSYRIR